MLLLTLQQRNLKAPSPHSVEILLTMEAYPHHGVATIQSTILDDHIHIAYLDYPASTNRQLGTVLLIHGFPQTSHQFRHILPALANKCFRCIAPDYLGAGASSKPTGSLTVYTKSSMAENMFALLSVLGITEQVRIVGHDIGGMIAFAMASRRPQQLKSVCWGECPLPGTRTYLRDRTEPERITQQIHFALHSVQLLPEALITGRERLYVSHFFDKNTYNSKAFSDDDVEHYANAYAQPGALSCAFNVYRAFEMDAGENRDWVQKHGKCQTPTLILSGEHSRHRLEAEEMALEVTESGMLQVKVVSHAGHYLAEENPAGFAQAVCEFIQQHD